MLIDVILPNFGFGGDRIARARKHRLKPEALGILRQIDPFTTIVNPPQAGLAQIQHLTALFGKAG